MKLQDAYDNILFFDLETTGLDPLKDYIIEFGAVSLKINEERSKFVHDIDMDYLVKIPIQVPEIITELTHITDEMILNEGIMDTELLEKIKPYITPRTLIVGYNVQFDINFLLRFFRKLLKQPDFMFESDIMDCMTIYKDYYPYPHKLCNAIETFNVLIPNSHRAIDDIQATVEVMRALMMELKTKNKDIFDYVNVIGFNPKYGVSGEKIPYIKYVSQPFKK